MGLFSKSYGEKIVDNLVGGFLFKGYFTELLKINGLSPFDMENKNEDVFAHDIQRILKDKVKKGELKDDEIELYFYFLVKQAIYIASYGKFILTQLCPNCRKRIDKSEYCFVSCFSCNTSLFNQYVIDYDKLNDIKIQFPNDDKSPYKNMDEELANFIQKYKPNSLHEKLTPNILEAIGKLGISEEEYYLVEYTSKLKTGNPKFIQVAVLGIHDDKVSYVPIADRLPTRDVEIYDSIGEISDFYFDDIHDLNYNDIQFIFFINSEELIGFQQIFGNSFTKELLEKVKAFVDAKVEESENATTEEEIVQDDEELVDDVIPNDVNPMQKIKEAKELFDIGAITQEEFDEIKSKYMKFI